MYLPSINFNRESKVMSIEEKILYKKLMANREPFVLLTPREQTTIMQAVVADVCEILEDGIKENWSLANSVDWNLPSNWNRTFRLREDYQSKKSIVEIKSPETLTILRKLEEINLVVLDIQNRQIRGGN